MGVDERVIVKLAARQANRAKHNPAENLDPQGVAEDNCGPELRSHAVVGDQPGGKIECTARTSPGKKEFCP